MSLFVKAVAAGAAATSLLFAGAASATTVVVDASANSVSGGTGKDTGITLVAGEHLNVQASPSNLWRAGDLPRFADADGMVKTIFATGTDESGYPAGTQIGAAFPMLVLNGYSAPYASLVGRIGSVYQLLGVDFDGTAWGSGGLSLYFWDENAYDNSGTVSAEITHYSSVVVDNAVPEPATWALMLVGFGLAGASLRRPSRRAAA
jgi:hypothetical protein